MVLQVFVLSTVFYGLKKGVQQLAAKRVTAAEQCRHLEGTVEQLSPRRRDHRPGQLQRLHRLDGRLPPLLLLLLLQLNYRLLESVPIGQQQPVKELVGMVVCRRAGIGGGGGSVVGARVVNS
jgi:hypothetical protein